jgi:hypothetical protein
MLSKITMNTERYGRLYVISIIISSLQVAAPLAASIDVVWLAPQSESQKYVRVEGDIEIGDWSHFMKLMKLHPDIAGVAVSSEGGSLDDGLAIAKQIFDRKLDTVLLDFCHSACAVMFLAGHTKYVVRNYRLTVHTAFKQIADWTVRDHVANGTVTWFLGHMGYPLGLAKLWVAPGEQEAAPITWAMSDKWQLDFTAMQEPMPEPIVVSDDANPQ